MKTQAFEYIIDQLVIWHNEKNQSDDNYKNKFTKLFLLKMLFFVSAVNTTDEDNLLDTFDSFIAMPFGPVEKDVYDAINIGIGKYTITDKGIDSKSSQNTLSRLDLNLKGQIDIAIVALKSKNSDLINYSAFDLVDLSHKWDCWKIAFRYAQSIGKNAMPMPKELIVMSDKYFKK